MTHHWAIVLHSDLCFAPLFQCFRMVPQVEHTVALTCFGSLSIWLIGPNGSPVSWLKHFSDEMGVSSSFWSFSPSAAPAVTVSQLSSISPLRSWLPDFLPWAFLLFPFQVYGIRENSFTKMPSLGLFYMSYIIACSAHAWVLFPLPLGKLSPL